MVGKQSVAVDDTIAIRKREGEVYDVLSRDETVGFLHQVGTVYVALVGRRLDLAHEVGQSLNWKKAARMVVAAYEIAPQASTTPAVEVH